jgi:hypothetical protein
VAFEQLNMPNDFVASLSLAAANPAAARSSASSQEAGRSRPLSRTSGSVSRTCLLIEHTFLTSNCRHIETTVGVQTGSMSLAAMNTSAAELATEYVVPRY